jgi:thiol:disulfide interchange protein
MRSAYRPMWILFIAILLMMMVSALPKLFQPRELVRWQTDFAAARVEAGKSGRPLLAYFTAGWCAPCERMKVTTFADERVEVALRSFIVVKINIDEHPELAREYAAPPIPRFVVLAPTGEVRRALEGRQEADEFLEWLKLSAATGVSQATTSR